MPSISNRQPTRYRFALTLLYLFILTQSTPAYAAKGKKQKSSKSSSKAAHAATAKQTTKKSTKAKPVASGNSFAFAAPADLQLIDPKQLGIFHYPLAGFVGNTKDSNVTVPIKMRKKAYAGTFHFFLRGLPKYNEDKEYAGVRVNGFVVFMDAGKARLWGGIKHEQPAFFVHYMPRVYLKDPFGNEMNVTITRAYEGKRPITVQFELNASWAEAQLMVDNFRRTYSLNNLIEQAKRDKTKPGETISVYNVIGQFHSLAKGMSARMMRMHIDWHRKLGVSADFVYVTSDYVKYLDDATLEPYLRQNFLLPVMWDAFPRIDQVVHYDQVIVYQHAMLALWQRNAYLFLTDFDELLVTPQPGTIPQLLEKGCLKNVHQALIDSFGTYCKKCLPVDGSDTPAVPEASLWEQETLQPLTEYTVRSENIIGLPKILGHADYVTQIFVHSAYIDPELHGNSERLGSDRKCVWIAHLRNMFALREQDTGLMVEDTSWMWPLADIDPKFAYKDHDAIEEAEEVAKEIEEDEGTIVLTNDNEDDATDVDAAELEAMGVKANTNTHAKTAKKGGKQDKLTTKHNDGKTYADNHKQSNTLQENTGATQQTVTANEASDAVTQAENKQAQQQEDTTAVAEAAQDATASQSTGSRKDVQEKSTANAGQQAVAKKPTAVVPLIQEDADEEDD